MLKKIFFGALFAVLLICVLFHVFPIVTKGFVGTMEIGIIGPQAFTPHWYPSGMKAGAELAQLEINSEGGIYLSNGPNGAGYYSISLVFGHEHAITGPGGLPEPDKAYDEMVRLCDPDQENCTVVIGGFRTECTAAMIEAAADYATPFFIIGAFADDLINDTVGTDYARYKYVFRTNPTNSTTHLRTLAAFCQYIVPMELLPRYGEYLWPEAPNKQVRVAVLAEDLPWNVEMYHYLTHPLVYPMLLGPYANLTYAARIPDGISDCTPWLETVNASEARLLIHLFSGVSGLPFIAQWGALNVSAVPVGVNVMGQLETHWPSTDGACKYECVLNVAGTRTPVIPDVTTTFWDNFFGNYTAWPLYTAWGAYDSMYMLAEALESVGSTNKDDLVAYFEDPAYERTGLRGRFRFASQHDVFSNEIGPVWTQGYVRPFVVQWQGGELNVVYPVDQSYSEYFLLPHWMPNISRIHVTDVETSKSVVGQGLALEVKVNITNIGTIPLDWPPEYAVVTTYYNDSPIESQGFTTLGPKSSIILSFLWNATGVAKGNYTISASCTEFPSGYKHSLTNSWVIVSMVGDITGEDGWPDGKCDMRDIGLVARNFGRTVPPAPANCDVTGEIAGVPDGKVDMRDIGLVAHQFGKIDP